MSKATVDSELVRTLADLLNETGLTEIEYENGGLRLRVAKTGVPVAHYAAAPVPTMAAAGAPAAEAAAPVDYAHHPGAVTAPMVGVVYLSPEPGAPHFVGVGSVVSEGQTLCLIEAMKTFNPVRATKGGTITRILVNDTTPVEYGEPLMIVE